MKYVWHKGDWVPAEQYRRPMPAFQVMGDIEPFISPIDGSIVGSRSTYRQHMKHHGVIDVGNERLPQRKGYEPKGVGQDIKRAWDSLT